MNVDLFETHAFTIKTKAGKPFWLVPFGDVHYGAPLHAESEWRDFCKRWKDEPNAYFLGMGDYQDLVSSSERDILNRGLHQSTIETMEDMYDEKIKEFQNQIEFMRGRIIGLIEGNHHAPFLDGSTSTQRMARHFKCRYLGVACFVKLRLMCDSSSMPIDIWAHHGKGAARLLGGSINAVQHMAEAADADIYLMGHDHKRLAAPSVSMRLNKNMVIKQKRKYFVRTGSFLKAYDAGKASYVAGRALNPVDLGAVPIMITPRRRIINGRQERTFDMEARI